MAIIAKWGWGRVKGRRGRAGERSLARGSDVDLAVTINVCFTNHFVNFLISQLLSKISSDTALNLK
ncbi:hypothetical protein MUK42_24751 [Musa troglodytarum]|uniref:Uncharacterized protein n=1 Tax=Musa troglodytarum TaxID=320322 RepID=A0A9E7F9C0_9LILI|nr:hypothetical protein MUK42_24751 [Musa troglodytarum]